MDKSNLWKIVLVTGIFLALVAFVLGWIGFGVPDWQGFRHFNGSTQEYYGLWAYCQDQSPLFNTVCQRWPTAEKILFNGSRPQFVKSAEGLITTGMILLTFALIAAVVSALLPLLAFGAAIVIILAMIFLIIGLAIFGREADNLSNNRGDAQHNHRYGFWLIVPTIVLSFVAGILWAAAGALYQKFGFGNIATRGIGFYGGNRNQIRGPYPPLYTGGGMLANPYNPYNPLAGAPRPPTTLLSQFIAQGIPRYTGLSPPGNLPPGTIAVQRTAYVPRSLLPQPSIVRAMAPGPVIQTAAPSYIRAPTVNLTGQPIVYSARPVSMPFLQTMQPRIITPQAYGAPGTYVQVPGINQPVRMIDMVA